MRTILVSGSARTALLCGGMLFCQPGVAQTATSNGVTAAADTPQLQDIVVTAQRRSENLQRVPIAVTAVTAGMAEAMGIKGTQDIPLAAPSVNLAQTNAGASVTIRGIGGNGTAIDEAANALYVDGVYQAATPSLVFQLNNIERIEVLKGPQGTLFGRNSTGGVIQIITRTPSHTPTADVSIGYANYDTVEAQGYLSGGLTNTLAADLALYEQHQGNGWGKDIVNGKDAYKGRSFVARNKIRWEPDAATTATLSLSYVSSKPTAAQGGNILPGETTRAAGGVASVAYPGFYSLVSDANYDKDFKQYEGGLTVEHDMGWARVVNIASYTKNKLQFGQDSDIGPANLVALSIRTRITTKTEELQLLSPASSPIKWSGGLFLFSNNIGVLPFITTGLSQGPGNAATYTRARSLTHSYAGYGQVTAPIFTDTNVTVGLRYTVDKLKLRATVTNPAGVVTPYNNDATDKKLTYRVSIDHQFTPELLAYASYNRGYKSGLFNIVSPAQQKVDPQTLDAYEIGFKSQLFDNRVRLNAAAFYYDFKDIQVRAANAVGAAILLNAASARLKGVDVDLTATPVARLTLQGSISYLDGNYRSFPNAPLFAPAAAGGLIQTFGSATGNNTVYSPKWAGSVGMSYKLPTSIGDFAVSGSLYYNAGYDLDPQNRVHQGDYALVGAGLSWSPVKTIELRVWGRNLTNSHYLSWLSSGTSGDQYYPGEPRTYGATARYRF